jgi:hypothetical protein
MRPTNIPTFIVVVGLALLASACSSSDAATPTSPSPTITTDVLTGVVQPPVNGALQSSFGTFVVGQGGGSVSLTLTSAVETLPGGVLLPTVTMGLAVGTAALNGGTTTVCTPLANAFTTAQAGATAQLNGTLAAGTYCAQVSDVTSQVGPVSYAVAVGHP